MHENPQALLTRDDVERRFRIGRSTIYRWMREGRFPEPVRIGPRAVRWLATDLTNWAAEQPHSHGDGIKRGD